MRDRRRINDAAIEPGYAAVEAGTDGVMAKRADLPYASGERMAMEKIKRGRTADCVVGGFRYATLKSRRSGGRPPSTLENLTVLSSSEPPIPGPARRGRPRSPGRAGTPPPNGGAPSTDALRIAVEALSAEICWYFAHDAAARAAAAIGPRSRRRKS
jgi:hypothetical protein